MMDGNNRTPLLPYLGDENQVSHQSNASNQLQLFGNLPVGCSVDPVNFFGNERMASMLFPNKQARETEDFLRQQKLQISLNHSLRQDEADRSASIPLRNSVSTGLRLSYDDDERNSSVTSASGSMTQAPSILLSLNDDIRAELNRQKEEFDRYMKMQEEQLAKGVRDMKQRHTASVLAAIEKGVSKKLQEKDLEIENMNQKNKELVERINQVAKEAQNWQCSAKYNESVVNVLKSNLQQAMAKGAEQGKEGFGDSEMDDAASYIEPSNYLNIPSGPANTILRNGQRSKEQLTCKVCKTRPVSILLMPCRHLCLCNDCDMAIDFCPVCHLLKTASIQVYLS